MAFIDCFPQELGEMVSKAKEAHSLEACDEFFADDEQCGLNDQLKRLLTVDHTSHR